MRPFKAITVHVAYKRPTVRIERGACQALAGRVKVISPSDDLHRVGSHWGEKGKEKTKECVCVDPPVSSKETRWVPIGVEGQASHKSLMQPGCPWSTLGPTSQSQ